VFGPIEVLITGLPRGVHVTNANAFLANGTPVFLLPIFGVPPQASFSLQIQLSAPLPAHSNVQLTVIAGPLAGLRRVGTGKRLPFLPQPGFVRWEPELG
jgi:hypothetical protein